jgi:hypothetical protein
MVTAGGRAGKFFQIKSIYAARTLMTKSLAVLTLILAVCAAAFAQSSEKPAAPQEQAPPPRDLSARVPPAKPADVKSIDAIVSAVYSVISGPAGERDWNRFRSLFVPEARLTSATKSQNDGSPVRLLTVDDYVKGAGDYFAKNGFFESAIVNRVQRFGNIAQVFTSYESRHAANDKPFTRGINSMQVFYDGSRWWVLSILWDEESSTNPLPSEMATRSSSPVTQ